MNNPNNFCGCGNVFGLFVYFFSDIYLYFWFKPSTEYFPYPGEPIDPSVLNLNVD